MTLRACRQCQPFRSCIISTRGDGLAIPIFCTPKRDGSIRVPIWKSIPDWDPKNDVGPRVLGDIIREYEGM
jgi:hypothetical protein